MTSCAASSDLRNILRPRPNEDLPGLQKAFGVFGMNREKQVGENHRNLPKREMPLDEAGDDIVGVLQRKCRAVHGPALAWLHWRGRPRWGRLPWTFWKIHGGGLKVVGAVFSSGKEGAVETSLPRACQPTPHDGSCSLPATFTSSVHAATAGLGQNAKAQRRSPDISQGLRQCVPGNQPSTTDPGSRVPYRTTRSILRILPDR